MCCGRGAGDRVPLNTHSITIGLLVVLYLNVYVRDLSETWALTININLQVVRESVHVKSVLVYYRIVHCTIALY